MCKLVFPGPLTNLNNPFNLSLGCSKIHQAAQEGLEFMAYLMKDGQFSDAFLKGLDQQKLTLVFVLVKHSLH